MAFLNAYQMSVFFSIFNEGKKSASTPPILGRFFC